MKSTLTVSFLLIGAQLFSQNFSLDWAHPIGGTLIEEANDIIVDNAGNIIATGSFEGTVDFDHTASVNNLSSAGEKDVYIRKTDGNGTLIWAKSIGSTGDQLGWSVEVDNLDNIYISGTFGGTVDFDPGAGVYTLTSTGGSTDFILKLDPQGDFVWAISLGVINGGILKTDENGNLLVSGQFSDTTDFDPGPGTSTLIPTGTIDAYILSLSLSGTFNWVKALNGTNIAQPYSIDALNGKIIVGGSFTGTLDLDTDAGTDLHTSNGQRDGFVVNLTGSGDFLWGTTFGSSLPDEVLDVQFDSQNNVLLTGYFSGTVDFDPGAAVLDVMSNGLEDIFIQQLDQNGNLNWIKSIGGSSSDVAFSLAIDNTDDYYVSGAFNSPSVDVDPGPGSSILSTSGGVDAFILGLNNNGDFWNAIHLNSTTGGTVIRFLSWHSSGLVASGIFDGAVDILDPAGTATVTTNGSTDAIYLKLNGALGTDALPPTPTVSLHPNPTNDLLYFGNEAVKGSETEVKILDNAGRLMKTIRTTDNFIDLSSFPSGMYTIMIDNYPHKIFKQ